MHSPVSIRHADLLNFVDRLLGSYVDRHRLGSLYREVVAVRLSGRNVFMPDLAFYRAGREAAIRETHISEAPDFPIAVILYRSAELPNRYLFRVAVLDMFSLLGFVVSLFPPNAVSTIRKISQKIDLSVGPLYKTL